MTNNPIITTERLILREVVLSDAEDLFEMDSDPLVHRYIDNQPLKSIDEEIKVIEYLHGQCKTNGIGRWAVIDKETGECLGWCGLKYFTTPENGHVNFYELGYRFKQKHWGKGYATESSKAVINYAFNTMEIDTIYAMVDQKNDASKHVLEKCGFKFVNIFYDEGQAIEWLELIKK